MNPLDLSGPEFLQLYAILLAAAFIAAAILRQFLRFPAGEPLQGVRGFDAFEVALLVGDDKKVINAVLAGLVHRGLIEANTVKRRLKVQDVKSPKLHPLESEVYQQIKSTGVIDVDDAMQTPPTRTMTLMHERLETLGLLMTDSQAAIARFVPLVIALVVPALGVIKVFVGVSRHRPVGYLIIFIIVSVALGFWLFGRRVYRSRCGDKALTSIRRETRALRSASRAPDRLASNDVCMAVALFGLGAVAVGALADLQSALRPPTRSGGSSWSNWSHGCGGGGCGGGGCGGGGCGGGCGGGGCGGCSG